MYQIPKSLLDVESMIRNGVQENIHLDYKASAALTGKRSELSKDVSAFANSDGGVIVFGVEEKDHLPICIDTGIDHSELNREQLENTIQSNVAPRIADLEIIQIQISLTHSIYVISIGRSERAPHQDRVSFRYYKRYNFKSAPMEDYEIQDIRTRTKQVLPLVLVDIEIDQGSMFVLFVENVGEVAAVDLRFDFSEEITWPKGTPTQFSNGIKILSKGRKLSFMYGVTFEVLNAESKVVKNFTLNVTYTNPSIGKRVSDSFEIDLTTFNNSLATRSELYRHGKVIENALLKLVSKAERIEKSLESLQSIAGPTGLDLSFSTWRNAGLLAGSELAMPRIDPNNCDYQVFQEVLGIDVNLAVRLRNHFTYREPGSELEETEGLDSATMDRLKKYFDVAQ